MCTPLDPTPNKIKTVSKVGCLVPIWLKWMGQAGAGWVCARAGMGRRRALEDTRDTNVATVV